jgi:hypothetical protein
MGTVFDPKPAVDSALPKMSAYEADATTQPADDYLPVLSVVQTTTAVLTPAGEFFSPRPRYGGSQLCAVFAAGPYFYTPRFCTGANPPSGVYSPPRMFLFRLRSVYSL